jgi:ubiquitin carboxyl-terminal hydrolase 7
LASDRFEDAREYYDFLEHKRTVKFHPHPTRCDQEQYQPFDLVLNSKINYDAISERVGAHLKIPPTHVRFWTVNAATNNPKTPVRRGTNPSLRQILNPMGTNTLNSTLRGDAFYFEVLDMSLAELDTKKSIKLTWLSEGITKEVKLHPTRDGGAKTYSFHRTNLICLCRRLGP